MAQNIAQNIANMVKTVKGEHILFRSFGLDGVDSPNRLTRSALQVEANRWYPSVIVDNVTVNRAGSDGVFEYSINLRGSQNG